MATDLGEVRIVSARSGEYGEYAYCFDMKDITGDRWITLVYRTQAEAQAARETIKSAVAGAIRRFYVRLKRDETRQIAANGAKMTYLRARASSTLAISSRDCEIVV